MTVVMPNIDERGRDAVREGALRSFAALRNQATLNGTADMPLDEINEEIRAVRDGATSAASIMVSAPTSC